MTRQIDSRGMGRYLTPGAEESPALIEPVSRFFWDGKHPAGWWEPPRALYDCELVYLVRGRSMVRIAGREYDCGQGSVLIIPPETEHETRIPAGRGAHRVCIHFNWTPHPLPPDTPLYDYGVRVANPDQVRRPPPAIAAALPLYCPAGPVERIRPELMMLCARYRNDGGLCDLFLAPVLRFLLEEAAGRGTAEPSPGKGARAVALVRDFIETHYAEPLDYADFCRVAGVSKKHLCTIFRRWMGRPPMQYLNRIRMEHARRLLAGSDRRVAEAARQVGIADANYFARLFRREFGVTPTAYIGRTC